MVVDGLSLSEVDSKTMPLVLAIQRHHETISLDIVNIASYDIVIGTP